MESATATEAESLERIADLKEQIQDDPSKMEWRYQLAQEYQKIGRNMDALKTYEEALLIDPGQSDMKYEYAELCMVMNDKKKAFQSYKEILLGVDGQQYLGRISQKFMDSYKVNPIIASDADEAFGSYSFDGQKVIFQKFTDDNWDIFEFDLGAQTSRRLTFDEAHEEHPAFSPDLRTIVFTSTRDDHRAVGYNQKLRDIYTLDLINNREVNLTTNSSNDWRPRFSRDGKFISFVSERSDLRDMDSFELFSHIFVMESDGSFQLELTKGEVNDGGPVMSGSENDPIFFDSNRNGDFAIYSMMGDGSNIEQLTFNSGANDVSPDISKDGVKIAFFSDRDGNYELYMMNNDGSNQQRLTSNPADDLNPVISPDGTKVLFHSNRFGNYDIFELDLQQKTETATVSQVVAMIDTALSAL
jgi:TolB protein